MGHFLLDVSSLNPYYCEKRNFTLILHWATCLRLDGLDNSESIFAAPSVGKYRLSVVFQNWSVQP